MVSIAKESPENFATPIAEGSNTCAVRGTRLEATRKTRPATNTVRAAPMESVDFFILIWSSVTRFDRVSGLPRKVGADILSAILIEHPRQLRVSCVS